MINNIFSSRPRFMAWQAGAALLLFAVLLFWQRGVLAEIYWGPLATELGMVVNGVIVALFLAALARIFYLMFAYAGEDRAVDRFEEQLDFGLTEAGIEDLTESLIVQRYRVLQQGRSELDRPQQATLSAILLNQETTRLGLIRLIQGLLILLGVFGTVASLSLALVGASDLLAFPQDGGGINLVVHGMATALSTTMTAIAAYLVLTLVFSRLVASQSGVCQRIELLTLRRLLPLVAQGDGNLARTLALRLKDLDRVAATLAEIQDRLAPSLEAMRNERQQQNEHGRRLMEALQDVNQTLKKGFRLDQKEP